MSGGCLLKLKTHWTGTLGFGVSKTILPDTNFELTGPVVINPPLVLFDETSPTTALP